MMTDDRAYISTVYETLPPEGVNVCLNCKRPKCPGYCDVVLEAERNHIPGRGRPFVRVGQAYPFRGGRITVREMCEMTGASKQTIYDMLGQGMNMEAIHARIMEIQAKKHAGKKRRRNI